MKRQRDSWFQEERVRDLAWRQNEELHRALQDVREENEELRRENAMLREDLAIAEKMLDSMRFRTPEGSRGDQGSGHEKRAIDAEQKGSHCPPEKVRRRTNQVVSRGSLLGHWKARFLTNRKAQV